MTSNPSISVVIPTRDRPVRLRWLLNALAEQTIGSERFEVIVANGSRKSDTAELLCTHELARLGVLTEVVTGTERLAVQRDSGWRHTSAPLIIFTDDDCRPPRDWLERALAAAAQHPGAIVQGATLPDPDELDVLHHAPYARTQEIIPPTPWAQTCNILYPRSVLELVGGFDLHMPGNFAGDDTDLALRAIEAGVLYCAAPEMLTYHAVLGGSLLQRLRSGWRWGELPYLVKQHPRLRAELPMWIFWKRTHALLPLALLGFALQRRSRVAGLLILPWASHAAPNYTASPRGRIRAMLELPSRGVIDLVEMLALARGSVRHRTMLL